MKENLSPPGTDPAEQVQRLLAAKRILRVVSCTQQWNNYGGVGNINAQPGKLRFLPIERQSIHELGYDDMGQ